jgi:protein subunit release factor B
VPERPFAAPQPRRSLENAACPFYEHELRKQQADQQKLEDAKSDIGWGHQIRSYVLDQSRIKDLRTNYEVGNTQGVLDGDLASLKPA